MLGTQDRCRGRTPISSAASGIRFFVGSAAQAVEYGLRGGLVVVPAAPALVKLADDPSYRLALLNANMALTDSMFMVLVWRALQGEWLPRTSGLAYLRRLLADSGVRAPGQTFWIMPSESATARNLQWLSGEGWAATAEDHYVAPAYRGGDIEDLTLLDLVRSRRPAHVIVASVAAPRNGSACSCSSTSTIDQPSIASAPPSAF